MEQDPPLRKRIENLRRDMDAGYLRGAPVSMDLCLRLIVLQNQLIIELLDGRGR